MSLLDRYLGELEALKSKIALESLANVPDADKSEFGFGKAIGRLEGIGLCRQVFEELLNEAHEKGSGFGESAKSRRSA